MFSYQQPTSGDERLRILVPPQKVTCQADGDSLASMQAGLWFDTILIRPFLRGMVAERQAVSGKAFYFQAVDLRLVESCAGF